MILYLTRARLLLCKLFNGTIQGNIPRTTQLTIDAATAFLEICIDVARTLQRQPRILDIRQPQGNVARSDKRGSYGYGIQIPDRHITRSDQLQFTAVTDYIFYFNIA